MPRKALALAAIACLTLIGSPGGAAPDASAAKRISEAGSARFQANGTGAVGLNGSVVAFGLLPERGRLVVTDRAGDGYVTLDGRRRLAPTAGARARTVRMPRAHGRFYVSGSDITLSLRGANMTISAAGSGVVRLSGEGQYSLNEGPLTSWMAEGGGARRVVLST